MIFTGGRPVTDFSFGIPQTSPPVSPSKGYSPDRLPPLWPGPAADRGTRPTWPGPGRGRTGAKYTKDGR